MSLKYTL